MDNANYYKIEKAIGYIEQNFKQQPNLDEIAKSIGLSKFHFQRLFKNWAGISPKRFIQFITIEHIKKLLDQSPNIYNSSLEVGLSSGSRIYDLFESMEAISPKEYIAKGKDLKIYYGFHATVFGMALLAQTDRGICALYFCNDGEEESMLNELKKDWTRAYIIEDQIQTAKTIKKVFANTKPSQPLKLFIKGTNFQIQVWKALLAIPEGKLVTYKDISAAIGHPNATRAVGTAIGHNPISFLIPCHRVINKGGYIGNYRWGQNRKRAIIGWENSKNNA